MKVFGIRRLLYWASCWFFFSSGASALDEAEIAATCQQILLEVEHWSWVEKTFANGHERYPADLVRRGVWIRNDLPGIYQAQAIPYFHRPSRVVRASAPGRAARREVITDDHFIAATNNGHRPSIRAVPDYDLNSMLYTSVDDVDWTVGDYHSSPQLVEGDPPLRIRNYRFEPHRGAEAVSSWSSGLTGLISNSGRNFNQLRVLRGIQSRITASLFRNSPYWVDTAPIAVDVPFHGSGPSNPELHSLRLSLDWRIRYYESLQAKGLPCVAAVRSGETLLQAQLAFERPDLFQGMIWSGPMHLIHGYGETLQGYLQQNVKAGVAINPLAFKWFLSMREQMMQLPPAQRGWEAQRPFAMPLLIIVGKNDLEVPPEARAYFRWMAREWKDRVFYVEVPGAAHDPFAVTETFQGIGQRWTAEAETRAARAWTYVGWFMRVHVLKQTDLPAPPYGWLQR
jgi:hypothetical protein